MISFKIWPFQMMSSHPLAGMLGKLNHVAIATPDLEKSSQFYKNLGAKVSDPVVINSSNCPN